MFHLNHTFILFGPPQHKAENAEQTIKVTRGFRTRVSKTDFDSQGNPSSNPIEGIYAFFNMALGWAQLIKIHDSNKNIKFSFKGIEPGTNWSFQNFFEIEATLLWSTLMYFSFKSQIYICWAHPSANFKIYIKIPKWDSNSGLNVQFFGQKLF